MSEKPRVLHLSLADPRVEMGDDLLIARKMVEDNGGEIVNPDTFNPTRVLEMLRTRGGFSRLLHQTAVDIKSADCGIALVPQKPNTIIIDRITANLAAMMHPLHPKPCLIVTPPDNIERIHYAEYLQNDFLLKMRSTQEDELSDTIRMLLSMTREFKEANALRPEKRRLSGDPSVIVNGEIAYDSRQRFIYVNGTRLRVIGIEQVFFNEIITNRGSIVTDDALLDVVRTSLLRDMTKLALWETHTRLKAKISALSEAENHILRIRGGYIMPIAPGKNNSNLDNSIVQRNSESRNRPAVILNGPLKVDCNNLIIRVFDTEIVLEPREIQVLSYLISRVGKISTKEGLIESLWGERSSTEIQKDALRTFISQLRKKLTLQPSFIETIRGVGYRMKQLDRNGKILNDTPT